MGITWVKHEFEVTDGKIVYWNEEGRQTKEKGNYNLKDCTVIECSSGEEGAPMGTYPFRVTGPGPKMDPTWELMLSASDESERVDWIEFIKCYKQSLKSDSRHLN